MIYIFDGVNVFGKGGHICQRWGKSGIKLLFLSEMKTPANVYVPRLKNKIMAFGMRLPHCQQSTLPPHFRHSSLILKTMVAMSSSKRIVVRSVTVIYTKMLPELDVIQTACLKSRIWTLIGRSAINLANAGVIFLWFKQQKHGACPTIYFSAVMNAKLLLMFLGLDPTHAEKL